MIGTAPVSCRYGRVHRNDTEAKISGFQPLSFRKEEVRTSCHSHIMHASLLPVARIIIDAYLASKFVLVKPG